MRVLRAGLSELTLARQAVGEIHERKIEADEALTDFLTDPTCYLYLAVSGDEVVGSFNGYALTHPHRRQPQFLLYEIDVRKSHRRQGLGASLINAFVAEARRLDAFGLWVVTDHGNAAAMAMYRKCGLETSELDDAVFSVEL